MAKMAGVKRLMVRMYPTKITLQGTTPKWHFEEDFPFPKVGYVNPLEGTLSETNSEFTPGNGWLVHTIVSFPIPSMYGIFTYIYHRNQPFM